MTAASDNAIYTNTLNQLRVTHSEVTAQHAEIALRLQKLTRVILALEVLTGTEETEEAAEAKAPQLPAKTRRSRQWVRGAVAAAKASSIDGEMDQRLLTALSAGPVSRGDLVTRLHSDAAVVSRHLNALFAKGLVHREGTGPRNARWGLGAKGAKRPVIVDDVHNRKRPDVVTAKTPSPRKQDSGELADTVRDEAIRKSTQCGHTLGPFKPSSMGAGSAFIARCTWCDTYVTVGKDSKITGPGVRHECARVQEVETSGT